MLPLKAKHYSNIPANNATETDFRVVYRSENGALNAVDFVDGTEQPSGMASYPRLGPWREETDMR